MRILSNPPVRAELWATGKEESVKKVPVEKNRRILIIDDNEAIHEDYRAILGGGNADSIDVDQEETAIFGAPLDSSDHEVFEIDSAFQGREGLEKVQQALKEGRPYAMAFVDVRMPPGWDGVETIGRIWQVYPELQVVICTAYSDYSWKEMIEKLSKNDQMLILKKPFDDVEVYQLAYALTEKWVLNREAKLKQEELETRVKKRTTDLVKSNDLLQQEIIERKRAGEELKKHRENLEELVAVRTSELAKQRSRLEAIFGSVKDAIITVDTELKVIAANTTTENICGIAPKNIMGKVFTNCLNQCNKSCHEVLTDTLKAKTTIKEYQIECRHEDRPKQIVIVTTSPLLDKDGRFRGAVLVIKDITRISDLERELRERHKFKNIIGKSRKMQDVYDLLEDLADFETTVLVTGESGTGKELVARALHYSGNRSSKPMVTVNCSALAETLLESELFGHVEGAFTGALRDNKGRFQAAHEGTILLDEIGDISPRIQLKLLRVLQEMEFERVGESTPVKVDVRVVACTNTDLKQKVRLGEFREDLYYRLKVMELMLPPLRERLEDIPLLVDHFCNLFNKSHKKNIQGLSNEVLTMFMKYPWPGNVRELEHAIERAFVLCNGRFITSDYIPSEIVEYSGTKRLALEKPKAMGSEDILGALNSTDWNIAKTSRLLGISRPTLYKKISHYNLTRSKQDPNVKAVSQPVVEGT